MNQNLSNNPHLFALGHGVLKRPWVLCLIGTGSILVVSWLATGWPLNIAVLLPMLLAYESIPSPWPWLASVGWLPILFLAWWVPIARSPVSWMPVRSSVLYGVFVALSGSYFAFMGKAGIETQGGVYVVGAILVNILACLVLSALRKWAKRRQTLVSSFLFHVILFVWFAGISSPWLGDYL